MTCVNARSANTVADVVLRTRTVNTYVPAVVGDPAKVPDVESASPGVSEPLATVYPVARAFVAASWTETATPRPVAASVGSVVQVGVVATTDVNVREAVALPADPTALIVNVYEPAVPTVPDNSPVPVRVVPVGKLPDSSANETAYVAAICVDTVEPTAASTKVDEVTQMGTGSTVTVNARSVYTMELDALKARTVNVEDPSAVGVPENTPEADNDTPAGKDPDTTVYVPALVAARAGIEDATF